MPEPAVPDYAPTLDDVAALVPSRPKNQYGRLSTFDETTQPTGDQVQSIIDRCARKLWAKFGEPVDALIDDAKECIALRAAMFIELSYFGDQLKVDRSPFVQLQALYTQAVADYMVDRSMLGADEIPGTADDQLPYWSFPVPVSPLLLPLDDLDIIEGSGPVDGGGSEVAFDVQPGGPLW